jgi:hypothetical protein
MDLTERYSHPRISINGFRTTSMVSARVRDSTADLPRKHQNNRSLMDPEFESITKASKAQVALHSETAVASRLHGDRECDTLAPLAVGYIP